MQFELSHEFIDQLRKNIDQDNKDAVLQLIKDLHSADIAEIYTRLDDDHGRYLFPLLDDETAADVLIELDIDERKRVLKNLPSNMIARQLIDNMDTDDAADVVGELSTEIKEEVLSQLKDIEHAGDIVDLLSYDEASAGGLMAKELIKVNENWNVVTSIREMRKQAEEVDEVYFVYVVNNAGMLTGTLSLKKLLLSSRHSQISDLLNPDIISVRTDTTSEEVSNIMRKYDLVALPVVDQIGRLAGRITIDDVVDVMKEEAERDYQLIAGISEDVESYDKVWILTRARLPWLLVGLTGGILVSQVIGLFEADLGIYPEMAFFMPLIAASAGNVGVQSSSIVVQGLANQSIQLSKTVSRLLKEFVVAMMNGFTLGLLMLTYNLLVSSSLALTFTVSTALFSVIIFASLFGTLIPLLLDKFKIDPALATGPFITTSNDLMGLIIYFSIGRYFYGIL
ncbi:MAG: magnesium transporter [Bacteroidales bacterium]